MNRYLTYFIVVCCSLALCSSCRQEELRVIQDQQEESFLKDQSLVGMLQGVTAHDGSHDNVIDGSNCFSINFPYACLVDGELQNYEQASDLIDLYLADDIEPIFPITVTHADYTETVISSAVEFDDLIIQCASGSLYNSAIRCVDFIYPFQKLGFPKFFMFKDPFLRIKSPLIQRNFPPEKCYLIHISTSIFIWIPRNGK